MGLIAHFTPSAIAPGDETIVSGFGVLRRGCVIITKGSNTEGRLQAQWGMAPEGYRKAPDGHSQTPTFRSSLVDTAGAYPGIGAEERGQSEAIARSTETSLNLGVPNVAVIVGEGGSGGAIALATANRVLMLEHAIYSVISPEGAASILWRDTARAQDAATNMKITADDMMRLGIIDEIVREPTGGAHRDPGVAIASTGTAIERIFAELKGLIDTIAAIGTNPQHRRVLVGR